MKTTWAIQSQITWSGRRWGRRIAYALSHASAPSGLGRLYIKVRAFPGGRSSPLLSGGISRPDAYLTSDRTFTRSLTSPHERKPPSHFCEGGLFSAFIVFRVLFLVRFGGDLLSHVLRRSTIGVTALNGRVRDGIGCLVVAMTTKPKQKQFTAICFHKFAAINISRFAFLHAACSIVVSPSMKITSRRLCAF